MDFTPYVEPAVSFSLANGLLHGETVSGKQYFTHMPFSLFPFAMTKSKYEEGIQLNKLFAELVLRICENPEFLFTELRDISDDFTCNLIRIAKKATQSPFYQPIIMGLLRSDYMIDESTDRMLQIELNTISCSFTGEEEQLTKMHQYLLSSSQSNAEEIASFMGVSTDDINNYIQATPFNATAENTCAALAEAVRRYNALYHTTNTLVLVVNQPGENNNVDQSLLTLRLFSQFHVSSVYQTHQQLQTSMTVKEGALCVNGREVAVVYFRSGYTPADYASAADWDVRERIECSRAIKCPNVVLHLAGCKKVQQQLSMPGVVESLMKDDVKAAALRRCFAHMYPADAVARGDYPEVKESVLRDPLRFVLKPQREGGGFNIWREAIVETLERGDLKELENLILMERIFPQEREAVHVKMGCGERCPSVSEIGFYSSVMMDVSKRELLSETDVGVLVRTKVASSFEGAVSAGFAVLNSPILTQWHCLLKQCECVEES